MVQGQTIKSMKVDADRVAPVLRLKVKLELTGVRWLMWRMKAAIWLVDLAQKVAGRGRMDVEADWVDKSDIGSLVDWAEAAIFSIENGGSLEIPVKNMKALAAKLRV